MGTWLALLIFGGVTAIVILSVLGTLSSVSGASETVKSSSILKLTLENTIEETARPQSFDYPDLLNMNFEDTQPLNVLVAGLADAAENKNISALYIECKGVQASPATLNALRKAVADFRASGKPVYAYGDSYSQSDYYIASVADSIYVNEMGSVDIHGIAGTVLYFKGLLDKLGVNFQVFKVGTYKSAVEPYLLSEMSEPARAQLDTLYSEMWGVMRDSIAASRKIASAQVDTLINNVIMLRDAKAAVDAKLVNAAIPARKMKSILASKVGCEEQKLNFVSPETLASQSGVYNDYGSKNQIAVLYATGEIAEGSKTGINCYDLVPQIIKLADDDNVKAMVLRVNSPGGSVFGSQEIAEALSYFQSKKKPIVTSMGDFAASGGYWISCQTDHIFADALTITGSIGIFGMIPNLTGTLSEIGVNPQTVATNPNGMPLTPLASMTPTQISVMQQSIEALYMKFLERVAKGRKLPVEKVAQIAEGRVWCASTAKKIGLIDEIGTLDDAISYAANLAGISGKEAVAAYPSPESDVWAMIAGVTPDDTYSMLLKSLGADLDPAMLRPLHSILTRKPEQALMPVIIFAK